MSAVRINNVEVIGYLIGLQGLKSQGPENIHAVVARPSFMARNAERPERMVIAIFTAKISTAVSSSIPETGRTRHANDEKPSYASGSELTRKVQPTCNRSRLANIN